MAKRNRDDFSPQVKKTLEKRVNSRCSNPECRVPTCGPTTDPMKFNNIGKAAHIAAAALGGARYDPTMSHAQRSSISNGIWLCANCADTVDRDAQRYSVQLLLEWKRQAEDLAKSEHGKPLPSERELAVFKAKALGENVSSQSIGDLLTTVHEIGKREIEHIDPRFTADISVDHYGTRIALNPYENVGLKLRLPSDIAPQFNEQLSNLFKHGHPLEISGSGICIEGSPLFGDASTQPIKVAIDTHFKCKALQRLNWIDTKTGKPMAAEIVGKVVGGTESFTFSGTLFGGLYECAFQIPLKHSGKQTLSSSGSLTFDPWVGQSVRYLPYFDKFYSLCAAIHQGQEIESGLESDGRDLMRCSSLTLMSSDDVRDVLGLLTFLSRVRDILEVFSADVTLRAGPITREEALAIEEVWLWSCRQKTLHGKQLGEFNATIIPVSEAEAEMLKARIQSGEPQLIRIEKEFAEPVSIMGQRLPDRRVSLVLSSTIFRIDEPISVIQTGQAFKLYFTPTEGSRAEVFVDPADRHG
ncbi:MAG: hypothetical protein BroJett020_22190 [Bacteroidota bacterium]|nr:MAG: hypothetical protein BroJett020_22190 [Bacteroidota bacterium]